jgi:replicative DNA helicase
VALPEAITRGVEEKFYDLRHTEVFKVMSALFDSGKPVDLVTVQESLNKLNKLESVGGLPFLVALPDAVPSSSALGYYIEIVDECFYKRKVIAKCTELMLSVYSSTEKIDQVADKVESEIFALRTGITKKGGTRKESIERVFQKIDDRLCNRSIPGIATGLIDLDEKLGGGFQPKRLSIIAGRPAVGKSSLLMTIMDHITAELGEPAALFSFEMPEDEVNERNIALRSHISISTITEHDLPTIINVGGRLTNAPLIVIDRPDLTINQVRAEARRLVSAMGVKLIGVDYLQLVNGSRKHENRTNEIGEVSRGLKKMAMELGIPVVALSSMSRGVEKEKRKPRLSDLRESGDIEQDADTIILLYEDDNDGNGNSDSTVGCLIAKNRGGKTGEIKMRFKKSITRYESVPKIDPQF